MNILYTCITGNYDRLIEIKPQPGWKYICFTDKKLASDVWEIYPVTLEPKIHRRIKLLPHLVLPQHEVSIWTDGNIELLWNLDELAALAKDFCTMRHPDRANIFDEAQACLRLKKDKPEIIRAQMSQYLKEGYRGNGLIGSGVIIRKNTAANREFGNAWWEEVKRWSVRDQLSFNYVADKLKLEYQTIGFLEKCKYTPHSPKGEVMQKT